MASKNAALTPPVADDMIIDLTDIIEQGIVPAAHAVAPQKAAAGPITDAQLNDLFSASSALNVNIPNEMETDIDALLAQMDLPDSDTDGLFTSAPSTSAQAASAPSSAAAADLPSAQDRGFAEMDSLLHDLEIPPQPAAPPSAPAHTDMPEDAELDALLGEMLGTTPATTTATPEVDTAQPASASPASPAMPAPSQHSMNDMDDLDTLLGGGADAPFVASAPADSLPDLDEADEADAASAHSAPIAPALAGGVVAAAAMTVAAQAAPPPAQESAAHENTAHENAVLLSRIDALEARLSDMGESINAVAHRLDALPPLSEEPLNAALMRLEACEEHLHKVQSAVDESQYNALEERLRQTETHNNALEERLRQTETHNDALEERLRQAETHNDALEERLRQAAEQDATLRVTLTDMEDRLLKQLQHVETQLHDAQHAWTHTLEKAAAAAAARIIREELTALLRE